MNNNDEYTTDMDHVLTASVYYLSSISKRLSCCVMCVFFQLVLLV